MIYGSWTQIYGYIWLMAYKFLWKSCWGMTWGWPSPLWKNLCCWNCPASNRQKSPAASPSEKFIIYKRNQSLVYNDIYMYIYVYIYIYVCVYIMIGKLIQTPHSILSIFYALCLKNCVDTGWVPTFFDVYGRLVSKSKRLFHSDSCAGFSLARSNSKTVVLSFGNLVTWKLGMEWTWFRPDPEWTGMGWLHVLVLDVWPLGERFFFWVASGQEKRHVKSSL